jgi:DNA-binding transcriptional ArsR family regulator
MPELTPSLWRTCRVLAGPTRLELLRRILEMPDQCVAELTAAVGLSETRASQELRRLQSRGLVRTERSGRWVRYRPVPDPKVPSAKPILAAMKSALAKKSPEGDAQTILVARAFSHERRLKIACALQNGPAKSKTLGFVTGISGVALARHLRRLKAGGVVRRARQGWELAPHPHPLAKCLTGLLRDA